MNEAKSVLMVTPRYSPAVGGIERHLIRINGLLQRAGYKITVLTSSHEHGLKSQEEINGVNVIRIPYGWDKNPALMYGWVVKNRGKLQDYRIVHVHGTVPLLFWILPLRFLNISTPTFATFHGFERDPIPTHFKLLRRIARRLVRKSMCIGKFIENMYRIKCDHITIGAVDNIPTITDEKHGLIYVGRLEDDTGIKEHIVALGILKEKYNITIPLTICGSGSLWDELSNLVDSLGIKVGFEGIVPNAVEIMKTKRIALAAGYLSILEAMSVALPVISVCKTPLKHQYLKGVLSIGGPISLQTTSEGVAKELARLINDESLLEIIAERGRKFAENMSWNKIGQAYLDMWRDSGC